MPDTDLRAWLEQARAILETARGRQKGPLVVSVRAVESGEAVRYTLAPGDRAGVVYSLSTFEREATRFLSADVPLLPRELARRMGRPFNSTFRTLMANLCDREPAIVALDRDGYRLTSGQTKRG